jgi:RimJ/RimL family protein N-acetyltransferase
VIAANSSRLFKKLFQIYRLKLYKINYRDIKSVTSKIEITFEPINYENYMLAKNIQGAQHVGEFKEMLNMNDFGLFVCVNGKLIGYGWGKIQNSKDYFYNIQNCYLCRFFVSPQYRGLGIYPCIIKEIMSSIKKEYGIEKYYIAVESNNISSINGITKVGFEYVNEKRFIRGCKITLNRFQLS